MRVIHREKDCIGCGACVLECPNIFSMGSSGRAILIDGKEKEELGKGARVLVLNDSECARKAASICPTQCIKVE